MAETNPTEIPQMFPGLPLPSWATESEPWVADPAIAAAYGLLQAEVLQLRKQQQELQHQLSLAQAGEKAALEHCRILALQVVFGFQVAAWSEQAQQTAILAERNRMAREIHDTLAQAFTSILMRLQSASLALPGELDSVASNLDQARDLARTGLAEARRAVYALHPQLLEDHSLANALRHDLQERTAIAGIAHEFCLLGKPRSLPQAMEVDLLRIGQEAITNACNHAQASQIRLQLQFLPQKLQLSIQDNGQGFVINQPATPGFGLISMQERAEHLGGQIAISSQPGEGTQIVVEVAIL